MRYLVLILILLVASYRMPIVEMEDTDVAGKLPAVVALNEVTALSAVAIEERSDFRAASFTAPSRKPVKSWLQSHQTPVVPAQLVEALPEAEADVPGEDAVEMAEALPVAGTAAALAAVYEAAAYEMASFAPEAGVSPTGTEADTVTAEVSDEADVNRAQMRIVSASVLNMRAGPSSRNAIVGALTNGEMALVTGEQQRGWVPVRALETDAEGWVFARYLGPVEES